VQNEILSYFDALFNGRHKTAADRPEPFDSGTAFAADLERIGPFLEHLPRLEPLQAAALEAPFQLCELQEAVEAAAAAKSPGLDGLSYEFYKKCFPVLGPSLLSAFNDMLVADALPPSLRRGVVRLLPKVAGTPTAAQLRPITLLGTDYKLLTKMFVNRLLAVLPDILTAGQLCSVHGKSIFDGAAAILSAVEYLQQRQLPGYVVSLDFFHAYDRVDLQWVDKVLAAFGFGAEWRRWIQLLHKNATAAFMLHSLSPDLLITFSIRQGDPLAMLLFIIQIHPLLHLLHRRLAGLQVGAVREAALGYVDDVAALSSSLEDLAIIDSTVADFEAVSGAILNRNRKSVVVGLGTWAGRQDWPLQWIGAADSAKIYGVVIAPTFPLTSTLSWDRVVAKFEATLNVWAARRLPTLALRRLALEVYGFSMLWYLAQILPLPTAHHRRIKSAASAFLWRGRLERLAWDELHIEAARGGLGLTCVASRAQALLAKQACHRLAAGGPSAAHIAYWIGLRLRHRLPALARGPHAEAIPASYRDLGHLLLEVFELEEVDTSALAAVTAKDIYLAFTNTFPLPKIEYKMPQLGWRKIWSLLTASGLPQTAVDVTFSMLHNILPLEVRRHRLNLADTPACRRCGAAVEDTVHFFTRCPRVAAAWDGLAAAAGRALGGPIPDDHLLHLHLPMLPGELAVVLAVVVYVEMVWTTRDDPPPFNVAAYTAAVKANAKPHLPSIFM
jgi:hypothetical protein